MKTENLVRGGEEMMSFSHLLVSTVDIEERFAYIKTHDIIATEDAFVGIAIDFPRSYPPLRIKTEPKVAILRKRN